MMIDDDFDAPSIVAWRAIIFIDSGNERQQNLLLYLHHAKTYIHDVTYHIDNHEVALIEAEIYSHSLIKF